MISSKVLSSDVPSRGPYWAFILAVLIVAIWATTGPF